MVSLTHKSNLALSAILLASSALAQSSTTDWAKLLIGHPLYLRGAWVQDKIDFDFTGKPITPVERGPLTLSAVDISSVKLSAKSLVLHGVRVILVASAEGAPLTRVTAIGSITQLPFTRQKQYKANEPVQFTVASPSDGDFTAALYAIFADGLSQLVPSVPPWWRCYAETYFIDGTISPTPSEDVLHCAETQRPGTHSSSFRSHGFSPVAVLQSVAPQSNHAAAELNLTGVSTVYATIHANNLPSDFQIISAVGGGLDESVLQAVSQFTFRAATEDGAPVNAGFLFSATFQPR